ncbi:hypothetical protein GYMLUDRAFT_250136 [Collybiopsis luxurians FD-317 M1]|uniref:Uncharacterized protein n=1 Tax=Collybiopsis luxurians FD-317 M1 TaxID=944289 RepID=A0A0D0BVH6_9AGAR|nr:hypothetical protein GYMLUDRAFT_250136 [Collybiopsis luxurians FD-317 M1]
MPQTQRSHVPLRWGSTTTLLKHLDQDVMRVVCGAALEITKLYYLVFASLYHLFGLLRYVD